jgi:hypothetical protein
VKKTISSFRELNRQVDPIVETLDNLLVGERALDLGRCDEQSSHESDGPTSHRCIFWYRYTLCETQFSNKRPWSKP